MVINVLLVDKSLKQAYVLFECKESFRSACLGENDEIQTAGLDSVYNELALTER